MGRPDRRCEVAIVGAGPAGAAAAIALSQAGRKVLLIDKRAFPREKVCGGCISGEGLLALRRLLGNAATLPGGSATEIRFVVGRHRFVCRPDGHSWLAPRAQLDAALVAAAERAGAETRFGVAASLAQDDGRWMVQIGDERVPADNILLASGLGSLPEQIGIRGLPCKRRLVAQQWCQPADPPFPTLGEIELHWLRGGYIGLATPAAGECVIAMAAEAGGQRGESVFERLRRLNPDSGIIRALPPDAPRVHAARGIAAFPWLPERLSTANVLLIGDAAGYAEPFTGEGIGQALHSAECAARAILESSSPARAYDVQMKSQHAAILRRTRMVGSLLRWPLVHAAARALPWVPSGLFSWMVRHIHVRSRENSRWSPAPAMHVREARSL